jgi:exodeoxyribonuclease VII large subunit
MTLPESYKVSELNKFIKDVLNAGFPQIIWICGEIQGYNRNKDKSHVFFEMVEKHPESKEVLAKVGLVIFAGRKSFIEGVLKKSENAFQLKDDIEVRLACKIDFYVPHGAVRLVVENIDPVYTLGKLAQERQRLIQLLKEKGILDENKKLPLPLVPLRIGLITSDDSAAYNDFCDELRQSRFAFQVVIRNTLMQGKKTETDVCEALKDLQALKGLDVIVITRGGGSIADLSCFDSQMIAEAIAKSSVPVLSGIGHEINTTITDLAAHTFEKTPTAIAKFIINRVQDYLDRLNLGMESIVEMAREKLYEDRRLLKNMVIRLQGGTRQYLKDHHERVIQITQIIKHRPMAWLKDEKRSLMEFKGDFKKTVTVRINNDRQKLKSYEKLIDMVHPANTIKRGFTITRDQKGKIIKSSKNIKLQEEISTEFTDGIVTSRAEQIKS